MHPEFARDCMETFCLFYFRRSHTGVGLEVNSTSF